MKITIIDIFEFIKFYDKVKIYKNIFIELLDLQNEFIILNYLIKLKIDYLIVFMLKLIDSCKYRRNCDTTSLK